MRKQYRGRICIYKPEEQHHATLKGFKVDQIVKSASFLDMSKHCHADDSIDEGDEKKQCTDIEESWQRNYQRE